MHRNFRYWGFLSYSHGDRRVAERLHRALEAYRIPARLVGLDGPFGPVPSRLLPIFRDRDELNAGGRLGRDIEHAIEVSRSLIVLCSPAAASSSWVDAEIAAFLRLRPDGPLFCVIVAGEPLAPAGDQCDAAECLPPAAKMRFTPVPALEGMAPIAVDLRVHGDGWRLAIHKIVAGLTGLPLDQLVQRDAHRRHRRMAWLATALVGVAIALGVLAAMAYQARDEARDQRAQAEGLIEFMLVDLRKRLEPAGRLDALEAVGERALAYYDLQPMKALDPDSLGRRARALHLIGEIGDRRGDTRDARAAFARASASTAELLARAPEDPERLYDHAQSIYWDGYIDREYGDAVGAERAFLEYAELARKLSAKDLANPDWLAEVGYAHANLGVLLLEQGRAAEAIPQLRQSLRINRKRTTLPGDVGAIQLDIGQDHSWLSSALYANRQLRAAIAERDAEIDIYARMLKTSPDNAQVKERWMSACRFQGEMHLSAGAMALARSEIDRSLAFANELRNLDSANVAWRQSAAESHVLAARLARRTGAAEEAQGHLDTAGKFVADFLARDPESWEWRVEVQESVAAEQAALYLQRDQLQQADHVLQASQQRLQETVQDTLSAARTLHFRIANEAMQAELDERQGDSVSAAHHWQRVALLGDGHVNRLDGETAVLLADAWRRTGKGSEADRLMSGLTATAYRDKATVHDSGANPVPH